MGAGAPAAMRGEPFGRGPLRGGLRDRGHPAPLAPADEAGDMRVPTYYTDAVHMARGVRGPAQTHD